MRKPQIGDKWKLNWMKHQPVKEIESFSPIWYRSRGCAVPAVWFYHAPKGKTITCSVRFLLEHGELVKPANNACNRPASAVGMQSESLESAGG
jgi:hypothetical protein